MHISMLNVTNDKAPVSGFAMYVVCDETDRTIKILHPVTLVAVDITHSEYRRAQEQELWPDPYDGRIHRSKEDPTMPLNEQVARMIEKNVKAGKPFSGSLVRRVLAALRNVRLDEVPLLKDSGTMSSPSPRGFAIKSDKRPGVIDAISSLLEAQNGVSVDEALAELQKQFPERPAEGMRTTIRCQINRLPGKVGRKLDSHFDTNRGKVYQWASA